MKNATNLSSFFVLICFAFDCLSYVWLFDCFFFRGKCVYIRNGAGWLAPGEWERGEGETNQEHSSSEFVSPTIGMKPEFPMDFVCLFLTPLRPVLCLLCLQTDSMLRVGDRPEKSVWAFWVLGCFGGQTDHIQGDHLGPADKLGLADPLGLVNHLDLDSVWKALSFRSQSSSSNRNSFFKVRKLGCFSRYQHGLEQ